MNNTITSTIWPAAQKSLPKQALLAFIGTLLLAVSAKVNIPIGPVPFTMQTFIVLILGIAYGSKLGLATGLLYLAEGTIGLPVFATGSGPAYLIGPTGGYLFGFALAMFSVGILAERGFTKSFRHMISVMLVGELIIFILGVIWLARFTGWEASIQVGFVQFIWPELFKIALAVLTVPLIWRKLNSK
ncbi:MAG: BioY family protein [Acidiferrobacteraceae bacterium]|nr:BioY family protein [Acidiferrobacteraceae bacterium]